MANRRDPKENGEAVVDSCELENIIDESERFRDFSLTDMMEEIRNDRHVGWSSGVYMVKKNRPHVISAECATRT